MVWLAPIDHVTMLPKNVNRSADDDDVEQPRRAAEHVVEHELEGVDDAGDDADVGGLGRRQDAEGGEHVDGEDRGAGEDDHLGHVALGVLDVRRRPSS